VEGREPIRDGDSETHRPRYLLWRVLSGVKVATNSRSHCPNPVHAVVPPKIEHQVREHGAKHATDYL
jgi:hypothetical protein